MSETKFYIGQPVTRVSDGCGPTLYRHYMYTRDCRPVLGLPNVWYQWNGGTEPPCETDQDVLVIFRGSKKVCFYPAFLPTWANVDWYMIIKAPEVVE